MHKYIGSDVTSMVTLPVIIFEPMTMLQKVAEVCLTFVISFIFLLKPFHLHHGVNDTLFIIVNGVLPLVGSGGWMWGSLYAVGVCL